MSDALDIQCQPPWTASTEEASEFIRRHGTPYDPASDDYDDPGPFTRSVSEGKNSPIYNAHPYHTKVPPGSIMTYLHHYSKRGDLVLDPFCGSGMTGVACGAIGRRAILSDLSPAATHIAYNYCNPVDRGALQAELERISEAVRDEFVWLYGTTCSYGHEATIAYVIWSDVYRCRSCLGEITLWDAAVDPVTGQVRESFHCNICGKGPWKKVDLAFIRCEPMVSAYQCANGCHPSRVERPITASERSRLEEIESLSIPYWYPNTPFAQEREMWRGTHRDHGIERVCDFWTKRNLWALARLWDESARCSDSRIAEAVRFIITGMHINLSKMNRFRRVSFPYNPLGGTLYVASLNVESNVLLGVRNKAARIVAAYRAMAQTSEVILLTQSATALSAIPNACIDYVFTDPPFGSNIFYSDCSFLWESWLGYFTDERYEAVWNQKRKAADGGKSLEDYERLMTEAFKEMHRVLKPGRWATVVFHNSDDRVWQAIQRGASAAGFEIVGAGQLDKIQLSFKGLKGEKGVENVTNKDVVLNLQKPAVGSGNGFSLAPDVESVVSEAIVEHLSASPEGSERGLQALQGLAVRALINKGYQVEVSWRSVTAALRHLGCKQIDGLWYLPGEEVVGGTFDIRDEASAIGWLRNLIAGEGEQTRGELTPRFQQASVGLGLQKSLAELLAENFILEERTNRWRLPASEERARLNDANSLRQRREINRLVEGHAERPYGNDELAELAIEAYGMGMYRAVLRIGALVQPDSLVEQRRGLLEQVQDLARLKLEMSADVLPVQNRLL